MALESLWPSRLRVRRHRAQRHRQQHHRQRLQLHSERAKSALPSHRQTTQGQRMWTTPKSPASTSKKSGESVRRAGASLHRGTSCTGTSGNTSTSLKAALQEASTSEIAASPTAATFPPPPAQLRASWVWGVSSRLSLLALLEVWALRMLGPMRDCHPSLTMAGRRRRTRSRPSRLPPSRNP